MYVQRCTRNCIVCFGPSSRYRESLFPSWSRFVCSFSLLIRCIRLSSPAPLAAWQPLRLHLIYLARSLRSLGQSIQKIKRRVRLPRLLVLTRPIHMHLHHHLPPLSMDRTCPSQAFPRPPFLLRRQRYHSTLPHRNLEQNESAPVPSLPKIVCLA